MTNLEIDPLLRKGFQLLQSRSRESADQLKALLEEAHRQRYGKTIHNPKLREEEGNAPKKARLDSPHTVFKSHTPSPTPSLKSESSTKSRKSDESDSDADMNDLAMEIGINCTVCKSFEQTSGNQLVECQECHSLYHQECHKPAVTHQEVTDPRGVWYCAKCCRNIKKQNSLMTNSGGSAFRPSASAVSSSKSSSSSSSTTSRPSPSKGLQRPSPFANLSSVSGRNLGSCSGSNSGSNSGSSNNLRSSLPSNNSSRSSSGPPAANSIMSAERRVHLMKKKAAKNAERRKII